MPDLTQFKVTGREDEFPEVIEQEVQEVQEQSEQKEIA